MKVKKYKAPTMPEAMKQIRHDLGGDAIILNSREVESGGFLGLFTKKHLEVVAAIDPDAVSRRNQTLISELTPSTREISKSKNHSSSIAKIEGSKETVQTEEGGNGVQTSDLIRLERNIQRMSETTYPGPLQEVYKILQDQDVETDLIEPFMRPLLKEWYTSDEALSKEEIFRILKDEIKQRLEKKCEAPISYENKYLLLAGPTGVGKTTTLAKLAAKAKLEDHKKIAFITADTYRIAAVDQLKAYADILNVPIEVAYTKEDFLNAKKRFSDRDLIFVDTAGRNFREASYIDELKKLIPFDDEIQTWLVFSLTAKYTDLQAVYSAFKDLNPKHSVFTKVDETRSYGAVMNFWMKEGIVPAYLTNGQNVPDDLIAASPEKMSNLLTEVNADA